MSAQTSREAKVRLKPRHTAAQESRSFETLEDRVVLSITTVTEPEQLQFSATGVVGDPLVIHADSGEFLALWQTNPQSSPSQLVARRYDATSVPIGSAITIFDGMPAGFDAAMDDAGNFVVATWSFDGFGEVWRFDADGDLLGDPLPVSASGDIDVAMNGDGDFVVLWDDGFEVHASFYLVAGPGGIEIDLDAFGQAGSVAIDDNGDFIVTWTEFGTSGNTTYYRLIDDSGLPITPARAFLAEDGGYWLQHDVDMDSGGTFVVTWSETGTFQPQYFVQSFNAAGFAITPMLQLFDANGDLVDPEITLSDIGDYAISWRHNFSDDTSLWRTDVDQSQSPQFVSTIWVLDTSISMNGVGDLLVATATHGFNGPPELQGFQFEGGETLFSEPVRLDSPVIDFNWAYPGPPAVAMGSGGSFVTTFNARVNESWGGWYVTPFVQRFDAAGQLRGYPTPTSLDSYQWSYINKIAADAAQNHLIVWQVGSWEFGDLWAQRFDSSGEAVGDSFSIATQSGFFDLVMAENGSFVIARYDALLGEIVVQFYTANGLPTPQGFSFAVNNAPSALEIDRNADGDMIIGWLDAFSGNANLYGRRWDAQTGLLGSEFQVNEEGPFNPPYTYPAFGLGLDDTGEAVFAWTQFDRVQFRRFDATSNPIGTATTVNDLNTYGYFASFAMTSAGDFVVLWFDYLTETLRARHFQKGGLRNGTDLEIAALIGQSELSFGAAINDSGRLAVAWYARNWQTGELQMSTQLLQIEETPSSLTIAALPTTAEGEGLVLSATSSIQADYFAWDLNGDGVFEDAYGLDPYVDWYVLSYLGLDGGDETYQLRVAAFDASGMIDISAAAELTIQNVAPWMDFLLPSFGLRSGGNAGNAVRGQDAEYRLLGHDYSDVDYLAGFDYHIDWNGDGTVDQVVRGSADTVVRHVYEETGYHNFAIYVTDKDGGASETIYTSIKVTDWDLRPDAADSSKTNLVWGGTTGADAYGFLGAYVVTQLQENQLYANPIVTYVGSINGKLIAYGQGGNDLFLADIFGQPTEIHGGAGDDVLVGGISSDSLFGEDGNDIIFGGTLLADGNDWLSGGAGRDLLIGHHGADTLMGGAGEDLLIAAPLSFGTQLPLAIYSIQSEWLSARPIQTRMANIRGLGNGPRNNGNHFIGAGETVIDDNAVDLVIGDEDDDWLLVRNGQDLVEDDDDWIFDIF